METAPTTPTYAIAEYNPIAAELARVEKYRGLVCDVTTAKGMAEAKAAHREVAAIRIALDKARKKVKEDVLERGRLIDGEAKRIFALVAAIEDPIKAQIDAGDRRIEAEREAAIKAEQDRIAAEERAKKEAEERKLAEEREKNAAEARRNAEERRKLEEERRAQQDKIEAEERERRRIADEEDRKRRDAIAAEERAAAARIAEQEKAAREARAKEDARIAAEREKLEAARREEEERQRKIREEAEAKERARRDADERARREAEAKHNELLDARDMLLTFKKRFGHLQQFETVIAEIDACLEVPA